MKEIDGESCRVQMIRTGSVVSAQNKPSIPFAGVGQPGYIGFMQIGPKQPRIEAAEHLYQACTDAKEQLRAARAAWWAGTGAVDTVQAQTQFDDTVRAAIGKWAASLDGATG